jgi:hypothetical protein
MIKSAAIFHRLSIQANLLFSGSRLLVGTYFMYVPKHTSGLGGHT